RLAGVDGRGKGPLSTLDAGLANIVDAVEAECAACGLADQPLVYSAAAAALRAGASGMPGAGPVLLLDVAIEHRAGAELVASLVARATSVLATAPEGDLGAIERLQSLLRCAPTREADSGDTSLARVQRHLFADSPPAPRALDDTVRLVAWPGEARECIEIARLLATEAAAGTPFERMAVLLHAPERYAHHLVEALDRAAIPAHFARGTA